MVDLPMNTMYPNPAALPGGVVITLERGAVPGRRMAGPVVRGYARATAPGPVKVAIGVLLLVAASATSAQMGGGTDTRRGGPASSAVRPSAPSSDERVAGPNLDELVQMRLGQLEDDLNLRPEQRASWNVYRERVLRLLDDTRRAARTITASNVDATAPKRLDALGDLARNRLTAVEDIVDAGKAFYATLTPAQQAIADRRLALPLATLTGSDAGASDARRPPGGPAGDATGAGPTPKRP
jgi:LTXXQ motif family protein